MSARALWHTQNPVGRGELGRGNRFSGCDKSNPPRRPRAGAAGPRGARGFIFPWPRFNFAALIWLRVFVRVPNDLQRAATAAPSPSLPSPRAHNPHRTLPHALFFLFASFFFPVFFPPSPAFDGSLARSLLSRWIRIQYFPVIVKLQCVYTIYIYDVIRIYTLLLYYKYNLATVYARATPRRYSRTRERWTRFRPPHMTVLGDRS